MKKLILLLLLFAPLAKAQTNEFCALSGTCVWTGTNSFANINKVIFADQQAGADASVKVNNCITAVIALGGGTCDARALGGSQGPLSQIIAVGEHNPPAALWVTLLLPPSGTWFWTNFNAAGTCLVTQYNQSSMVGTGTGEGTQFYISAGGTTSAASVHCTEGAPTGGGSYIRAEGFNVQAASTATLSRANCEWRALFDNSVFSHINCASSVSGSRDLWVHQVCCNAAFWNISAEGMHLSTPFWFGDSAGNTGATKALFVGLNAVHPGSGLHAIVFDEGNTGNAFLKNNSFYGVYMEPTNTADTTTSLIQVSSTGAGITGISNVMCGVDAGGFDVGGSTRYMADIATNASLSFCGGFGDSGSGNLINEHNTGRTISLPAGQYIDSFNMIPAYHGSTEALGVSTVAALPPTATNVGVIMYVIDSTVIAAEGQACAGGGAVKALAFSTGAGWKCF